MVSVADINDAPVLSLPPDFFVAEPSTFVADLNQSAYIEDEDNYLGLGKDEIRWSKIGGADEDLFYLIPMVRFISGHPPMRMEIAPPLLWK